MASALYQNHKEHCVICEEPKEYGFHLYTKFICMDCEKDIVRTETSDPKYNYYLEKLKKVTVPQIYS